MNFTVMFLARGNLVNPKLRGTNLLTKYGFLEGSCVITNKAACMDDEAWEKLVKMRDTDIRKMNVRNVDLCFVSFIIYIYI